MGAVPFEAPASLLPCPTNAARRRRVGCAVFAQLPTSEQIQKFLDRAIRTGRYTPQYVVTDQGKRFWCGGFESWCKQRGIRPRYGAIGQPASIAIVERFIRSMKHECTRCLLVPVSLAGKTPSEVCAGRAELENSHPLDRGVVRPAFGAGPRPSAILDKEFFPKECDLGSRLVKLGMKPLAAGRATAGEQP